MAEYIDSIHSVGEWKNSDPIDLSAKRDKPILLYFWRSHTPASVEILHELNMLAQQHGDDFPVHVLAIHAPEYDDDDSWEELLDHFKIDLPVFHDSEYHTWEQFDVQHAPYYIVLDEKGNEVMRRVGNLDDSGLRDYLFSLME
ncbi:MAG: TlpA disulfide reductase family protein [Patescibacteria group bacterium]|jgi:thiol-disulfide isomerase/thioredoxin